MYKDDDWMCNRRENDDDDYYEKTEKWQGEDLRTTVYSDGSSTVHWGGPCGSTQYDAYGEEC